MGSPLRTPSRVGSWSPLSLPGCLAQESEAVESMGHPPHLGELDLQVADGARQGRRFPICLSVFHSPVGGGHDWFALPVPCPRRTSSAWAVRSLLRVTAPRLYAAPHASRPRGPPNWLQDGEREGGRGRGGGDRAAAATPPVVPAPAGAGRSQPDLGCGQRALSAHRHRRAPKPRASFRSPVGCPSASLEGVTRPLN